MNTINHRVRGQNDVVCIESQHRSIIAHSHLIIRRRTTAIHSLLDDFHQIRFADRRMGRTLVGMHITDYIWAIPSLRVANFGLK